ncbi:MAG: carbohydrate kinase family protein [candidate division KSB1 bacterium]|nr:carbohydrate kinase family protein [candidate division KSB1 bacterium]
MKVAILGTIVSDRILHVDATETRSLGGIYYTVIAAAHLFPSDWELIPICRVGADIYPAVLSAFAKFPNLCLDGIRWSKRENTQVTLVYTSPVERVEYTTPPMPPLGPEDLEPALEANVCLVNFITGKDVRLCALQTLANSSRASVYLDIHSLTLGIGSDGSRYYRYPKYWKRYARTADLLQMNEREAACLARMPNVANHVEALKKFLLGSVFSPDSRVRVVNITLGEKGSILAQRQEDEVVALEHLPPLRVPVVDPTGCGDTFAVAFLASFLRGTGPREAARFANRVAGFKCTLRGSEELAQLSRFREPEGGFVGEVPEPISPLPDPTGEGTQSSVRTGSSWLF